MKDHLLATIVDLLESEGIDSLAIRRVTEASGVSAPSIYEFFGSKDGMVEAVCLEGFRQLAMSLNEVKARDGRGRLEEMAVAYRRFLVGNPELGKLMLARPVSGFETPASGRGDADAVREAVLGSIRGWIAVEDLSLDAVDAAHAFVALVQGLAAAEIASRLGTSGASMDRRWRLGVKSLIDGLAMQS